MTKKRLFVDMDGTLARFHDQVNYLERMFEKDFFHTLKPFENMVAALRLFMIQHPDVEVFTISARVNSTPAYCEEEKNLWLDIYLPQIDQAHRIYTDMGRSKADYIPGKLTKDDFLLDDYNRGLNLFLHGGGNVIKCHNNINQRGTGLYGGSAGHMWMGPMVHTADAPELIAAELSQHMSLEYHLDQVLSAYPDISFQDTRTESKPYRPGFIKHIKQIEDDRFWAVTTDSDGHDFHGFSNILNALRFLNGEADFREYLLSDYEHNELSATALELRSVCFNTYQNEDYRKYLRADRTQLADDLRTARNAAAMPIMGQISYLQNNGTVGYSRMFTSHEEMQTEIEACKDQGVPFKEEWFIKPGPGCFHEVTDIYKLTHHLYHINKMLQNDAYQVATALVTPYSKRTEAQMQALVSAWHEYKLDGTLQEFLRLNDEEMQDFLKSSLHQPPGSSLEHMIQNAGERAGIQTSGSAFTDPER